jgi:hypothetical protein
MRIRETFAVELHDRMVGIPTDLRATADKPQSHLVPDTSERYQSGEHNYR